LFHKKRQIDTKIPGGLNAASGRGMEQSALRKRKLYSG